MNTLKCPKCGSYMTEYGEIGERDPWFCEHCGWEEVHE